MTDQEHTPEPWTPEVFESIHNEAQRRWRAWNKRGAVPQAVTEADSYDYHVARAAWDHAMQGIRNPAAVRGAIQALREVVSVVKAFEDGKRGADLPCDYNEWTAYAKQALAALDAEESR